MSLLYRVILANECTSTHHKLAIEALQHLRGEQAHLWRDLFLLHFDSYLDGSKAPDTKFKDFRNHVLHVSENDWGGAIELCTQWYAETVQRLREKKWREAAFAAGVMSHYYTDPLMPFHTGQSEEETQIHRAVEWSVIKSYDRLREILTNELGGFPEIEAPRGDDWLAQMVRQGARKAHTHYDMIVEHYNFAAGVKDPPSGFDQEIKDAVAAMLGHAIVGLARILDRAFIDAAVEPKGTNPTLGGYLATVTVPIAWVVRKLGDGADRSVVKAMYGEFKTKGRVRDTIPADDREVRRQHADEVLHKSIEEIEAVELGPIGAKHGTGKPARDLAMPARPMRLKKERPSKNKEKPAGKEATGVAEGGRKRKDSLRSGDSRGPDRTADNGAAASHDQEADRHVSARGPAIHASSDETSRDRADANSRGPRTYLSLDSDIVDAPSIGNKTARRFHTIGIKTVADFVTADPVQMATRLKTGWLTSETLRDWQDQAALMCDVPGLRGHDAQFLVACELRTPADVAGANPEEVLATIDDLCKSPIGQRILRDAKPPELEEVRQWIRAARQVRSTKAA